MELRCYRNEARSMKNITSCFIHSHETLMPIRHEVVVPREHDSPTSTT